MQKLTHQQNVIILVALENFLSHCQNRDIHQKNQIEKLIELYDQQCYNIK
jgi:hypothetical protein